MPSEFSSKDKAKSRDLEEGESMFKFLLECVIGVCCSGIQAKPVSAPDNCSVPETRCPTPSVGAAQPVVSLAHKTRQAVMTDMCIE